MPKIDLKFLNYNISKQNNKLKNQTELNWKKLLFSVFSLSGGIFELFSSIDLVDLPFAQLPAKPGFEPTSSWT